jgi:hypothetical protein
MRWPVPLGVRVRPSLKFNFLAQLADCGTEAAAIDGFPEFEAKLNGAQLLQLEAITQKIAFSQHTGAPIGAIAVIGHADRTLRFNDPRTARAKEAEVSLNRAKFGKKALIDQLKKLPNGAELAAKIEANTHPVGKGATDLRVPNAKTEKELEKNRRVEFRWARCLPQPVVHPSIEFPPRPAPNEADDPNVIFAGQRFRCKIIEGVSASFGVGGYTSLTLAIWDIDNNRLAGYDYDAGSLGAGVNPNPFVGETRWFDFTTPVPLQVDQFDGKASHRNTALVLSIFTLASVHPRLVLPGRWRPGGVVIGQWTGFAPAIALETEVAGALKMIPNTVRVYRGP